MGSREKLQVRIGIDVGEPISDSNDLFGTTVQTAARLCQKAEPNCILISRAVRDLADGHHELVEVGPHTLKGFSSPVVSYQVKWT
jgi:class 3 adenylate cyclase